MSVSAEFDSPSRERALIACIKSEGIEAALKIRKVVVMEFKNLGYIILANGSGLSAVYLIYSGGSLRRMIRPPKDLKLEN
jgi:hypothetical protein